MPNPPKLCPTCRAPIPADAPAGLCPGCLLLGAAAPTEPAPGALASAPSMGQVVAAFPELEVVELFAHGGMGVIYKARQPRLERLVALKILPPKLARQPGFTERFTREARALARLNHPHIVSVYDFGERDGLCFLIMEFVNGVNLREAMRAGVTPEQALALVPGICEALQFAHDHGVLHRDIKPENILLDVKGTPKLADFGIAKLAEEKTESALTMSGDALGTAAYMAPEQIEKPASVDHRADIYSLGVVLYEMLTGELPLGRFAAPSSKAKVTTGVDDVVFRALEKERELRQQSATEMKTQVEHATATSSVPPGLPDDDWVLRCPACGHISAIADKGIRIAAGSLGKRILARCPNCEFTGYTPLIPARQARADQFVPDPGARQRQGRAFAIAGALMNIAPIVLIILAVWPTWRVPGAWPDLEEGYGALRVDSRQTILTLLIPAAATASIAFGFTAVALWVKRYRAPWFFRWLTSYGLVTSPALIGVVILGYCFSRREEFLAERDDSSSPDDASTKIRAARQSGMNSSSRMLVATVIVFVVVLFAVVNWLLGNRVSPIAMAVLAAAIVAFYRLGTVIEIDPPLQPAGGIRPFPWQVPVIFAVMAIPFAALLPLLPWTKHLGFSSSFGVTIALLFPVFVGLYAALIAGAFRGLSRSGAPRWMATAVAILLCLLLPSALLWSSSYAPVGGKSLFQAPDGPSGYDRSPPMTIVHRGRAPFIGRWKQGSVELVAISRHPSAKHAWWRMDGSAATEGPFINRNNHVHAEADQRAYEFYFRLRDLPPGASVPDWMVPPPSKSSSGGIPALAEAPENALAGYTIVASAVPSELTKTSIKTGLAYEPWHTVSTSHPTNSIERTVSHAGLSWKVTHGAAIESKGGEVVVTFSYPWHQDWETRVAAVTHNGVEAPQGRLLGGNQQATWTFPRLSLNEVKEFRFQVRPIRWVEFRDIALRPNP